MARTVSTNSSFALNRDTCTRPAVALAMAKNELVHIQGMNFLRMLLIAGNILSNNVYKAAICVLAASRHANSKSTFLTAASQSGLVMIKYSLHLT